MVSHKIMGHAAGIKLVITQVPAFSFRATSMSSHSVRTLHYKVIIVLKTVDYTVINWVLICMFQNSTWGAKVFLW